MEDDGMSTVSLKKVKKVYPNGFEAVKGIDLEIEDKEFIVLVGPSGCGKTTTLRMIAGLESISEGELFIGDDLMNDVAPKDRNIAMVFQNYALYPHMTVYDNMAFGLKLRKIPKDEIDKKVQEAAAILGIESLLDRKPKMLSGGQRQRVALGRSIVRSPKLFLMDEPLSNLDAKLRVQMRTEISKLHMKLDATFVYVTHDQTEAMTMGTRIVVMKDGVVQQVDTPENMYKSPANEFVASFIGSPEINLFKGTVLEQDGVVGVSIHNEGNDLFVKLEKKRGAHLKESGYIGKEVSIGVRPEDIKEYDEHDLTDDMTQFSATVEVKEMMGAEIYIYFTFGGKQVTSRVKGSSQLKVGDTAHLRIKGRRIHLFDAETGVTLV
jgi:multiple sugar transport system ATP-binding protein